MATVTIESKPVLEHTLRQQFAKSCDALGISADLRDFDAELDRTLEYDEAQRDLAQKLHLPSDFWNAGRTREAIGEKLKPTWEHDYSDMLGNLHYCIMCGQQLDVESLYCKRCKPTEPTALKRCSICGDLYRGESWRVLCDCCLTGKPRVRIIQRLQQ